MLTILCGEDNLSSRKYLLELKEDFRKKNFEIIEIHFSRLEELAGWRNFSVSLFTPNQVYFTESLNKKVSKTNIKFGKIFDLIVKSKEIILYDWENQLTQRELKITKGAVIKEFKPQETIFKLLDFCYPGNLKSFVSTLHNLPEKTADYLIFSMLAKHIRNLIIVKNGQQPSGLQSWQTGKLKFQAKFWKTDSLIAFYQALFRIDLTSKTSKNPFQILNSLDLMACYFL